MYLRICNISKGWKNAKRYKKKKKKSKEKIKQFTVQRYGYTEKER